MAPLGYGDGMTTGADGAGFASAAAELESRLSAPGHAKVQWRLDVPLYDGGMTLDLHGDGTCTVSMGDLPGQHGGWMAVLDRRTAVAVAVCVARPDDATEDDWAVVAFHDDPYVRRAALMPHAPESVRSVAGLSGRR